MPKLLPSLLWALPLVSGVQVHGGGVVARRCTSCNAASFARRATLILSADANPADAATADAATADAATADATGADAAAESWAVEVNLGEYGEPKGRTTVNFKPTLQDSGKPPTHSTRAYGDTQPRCSTYTYRSPTAYFRVCVRVCVCVFVVLQSSYSSTYGCRSVCSSRLRMREGGQSQASGTRRPT